MYRQENKGRWQSGTLLAVHGVVRRFVFCKNAGSDVLMEGATRSEYDLYSAVTFFLVGVGIGSVLVLVCTPKQRVALEGISSAR
jgi:hypothetical protein